MGNNNAIVNVITDHSEKHSAINVDRLFSYAKTSGTSFVLVSDYNTLGVTAELIGKSKEYNIKVSVGLRIQLKYKDNTGYITLIAKNHKGYKALCKIQKDGYNNQLRKLPIIDFDTLKKYCGNGTDGHDNVILSTAGMDGLLFKMISRDQDETTELMKYFITVFGRNNVFVEVQFHGFLTEKEYYPKLAFIAESLDIDLIATNDPRYIHNSQDEILAYQIIQYNKNKKCNPIVDEDREYYIKTDDELKQALSKILSVHQAEIAVGNIQKIADACDLQFLPEKHYPKFYSSDGRDSNALLKERVYKSTPKRYKEWTDLHKERVEHELKVITSMGFADYILIVADYVSYARNTGEKIFKSNCNAVVGPGRGSAAGSIVCFLLGITDVEPISNGLIFERFLNPSRSAMPDIDIDFADCVKDKVIDYVKKRYGNSSVCRLGVKNRYTLRSAFDICSKYLLQQTEDSDFVFIGEKINAWLVKVHGDNVSINEYRNIMASVEEKTDPEKVNIVLKSVEILNSIISQKTKHSAGIVISDRDITDYVSVKADEDGTLIAECDKYEVESFYGLIKMDFLVNYSLDHISYVTGLIKLMCDEQIIFDLIPQEEEVYNSILAKGYTDYIFQLSGKGMKSLLRKISPSSLDELMLVISANRPGPKQFIDQICRIKAGKESPEYIVPQLEPILCDTYGCIIYQEQVMRIFIDVAGYSVDQADSVRSAISKKKKEIIEKEHDRFVNGCKKNGIVEAKANELYDQIVEFAEYCFNKSHASAYALVAYRMAWLLYHYPQYFLCYAPLFEDNKNNKNYLSFYKECVRNKITLVTPDVNMSGNKNVVKDDRIILGFSMINGVGSYGDKIKKERLNNGEYKDFIDFLVRVRPDRNTLKYLADSGAFDRFSVNRVSVVINCTKIVEQYKCILETDRMMREATDHESKKRYEENIFQCRECIIKLSSSTDSNIKLEIKGELKALGFPVNIDSDKINELTNRKRTTTINQISEGEQTISGVIVAVNLKKTQATGADYEVVELYDGTGIMECTISSKYYDDFKDKIKSGIIVSLSGSYTYNKKLDQFNFWVNSID